MKSCFTCNGTGTQKDFFGNEKLCEICNGTGNVDEDELRKSIKQEAEERKKAVKNEYERAKKLNGGKDPDYFWSSGGKS